MVEPHTDTPAAVGWSRSLLWAIGLWLIYTANGRPIGAGDVVPATLMPLALIRGDGPVLDRFDKLLRTPEGRLPGYVTSSRGHTVSRYPIGAAIVAVPFVLPQVLLLDAIDPNWERDPVRARRECQRMGKHAAAAITALGAVALLHLLCGLGLGNVAPAAVAIVALGSDCWAVASQALWQHGPALLCFTSALFWLQSRDNSRRRLFLAGIATALMVACRPIDVVFAGAMALWVLGHHARRERICFFAPAIVAAIALCGYNLWFFDTLSGGYAQIETMHPWAHGLKGTWTGSFWGGAAGTLMSPSHGLFVYCPWLAVACGCVPMIAGELRRQSLVRWGLWSLVPSFILLSKYSCWWGGHSFGPRFWIDATPLFAIILGASLEWARTRYRPLLGVFAITAAASIGIQAIGAICYPSTWHSAPTNADRDHERLWAWRDSELTRCLAEGARPRMW